MTESSPDKYQRGYSQIAPIILDANYKAPKIGKLLAVLRAAGIIRDGAQMGVAADVGSSSGMFAKALGGHFESVFAFDIDADALRAGHLDGVANVHPVLADSQRLPLPDACLDLVICNHVYEHVPDAGRLFDEIHRVLRPGGACYFGAVSRLTVVEPHYSLPFLSWLPKWAAGLYLRIAGRGHHYYENLRTLWGIRKLLPGFSCRDFTIPVLRDPDRYMARDMIRRGGLIERVPAWLWRAAYVLLPSYILVLTKIGPRVPANTAAAASPAIEQRN